MFWSVSSGKNLTAIDPDDTTESGLDFQTAYSIIWPQQPAQIQVGGYFIEHNDGMFNRYLTAVDAEFW